MLASCEFLEKVNSKASMSVLEEAELPLPQKTDPRTAAVYSETS
jgi:hypothetical protein